MDAATVADRIDELVDAPDPSPVVSAAPSWQERLWTAPSETRIGRTELLEALGRTQSWLYRRTSPRSEGPRIPHRKLHGELVFVVAEVRRWLIESEEIVVPGRQYDATPIRPVGVLHNRIAKDARTDIV